MKKLIVLLLFYITAAGTFFPCCQDEDCCKTITAASSSHDNLPAEGACSPFFACATCPGSVETVRDIRLIKPAVEKQVYQLKNIISPLTTYSSSFWQPPRSC